MAANHYSPLFQLAGKFLKYFILGLFSLVVTYVFSLIAKIPNINSLLIFLLQNIFLPLAILLLGIIALGIIMESLR